MEIFVQFARMEVRDELVQLPWNTAVKKHKVMSTKMDVHICQNWHTQFLVINIVLV